MKSKYLIINNLPSGIHVKSWNGIYLNKYEAVVHNDVSENKLLVT
jgi:hypothetical protein